MPDQAKLRILYEVTGHMLEKDGLTWWDMFQYVQKQNKLGEPPFDNESVSRATASYSRAGRQEEKPSGKLYRQHTGNGGGQENRYPSYTNGDGLRNDKVREQLRYCNTESHWMLSDENRSFINTCLGWDGSLTKKQWGKLQHLYRWCLEQENESVAKRGRG